MNKGVKVMGGDPIENFWSTTWVEKTHPATLRTVFLGKTKINFDHIFVPTVRKQKSMLKPSSSSPSWWFQPL